MADVNNKLRLQIVTQLDAAGIKATKDQVDQLELGIRRAGNSGAASGEKFGKMEKALGKLPGRIGEIAGKLGGLAGQAVMVAGAFSTGVEIGNKIVGVMREWGWMPDAVGDLNKATKQYNHELESLKASLSLVVDEEMKRMDAASSASEKAIKKIDDETAAYFRQASALKGLREAQGSGEVMQLERAKFEEMRDYSMSGYTEAAEQIGRYYDVLVAELQAKQQIAAFDRESMKLDVEREQFEDAYAKAADRAAQAKEKQRSAEADLAAFRHQHGVGGDAMYTSEKDVERDNALEKIAERAKKNAEKADEVLRMRAEKLETVDADVVSRQMQRANLAASGTLAVDRAAAAYDDYVASAGNPLNAEIDPNWSSELLRNSQEAYQTQRDLLEVCKAFGDRLEKLLELK